MPYLVGAQSRRTGLFAPSGRTAPLSPENKGAARAGRDDVEHAVLVQVRRREHRADAGPIVDELGHELAHDDGIDGRV